MLQQEKEDLKLSFKAFDKTFHLRLKPDHNDADVTIKVNGNHHPSTSISSYFYVGYDKNDPTAAVHGNLAFGVFEGTIYGSDDTYYIEPADRYFDNVTHHSVIYRQSDSIMNSSASFCGVSDGNRLKRSTAPPKDHLHARDDSTGRDPLKTRCKLNIVTDYYFYQGVTDQNKDMLTRVAQATAIIKGIVAAGSINFARTDFDGDMIGDNINFAIKQITIQTNNSDSTFSDEFIGVEALLNALAQNEYDNFCLSYLFTYRDFDQGVLGLAFVASSGSPGGICDKRASNRNYNVGLVTLLNYGNRVTRLVSELTFTHEAGHNFGSQHDTDECNNAGNNNYVMFPFASDGKDSNNNQFSQCSKDMIYPFIRDRAQSTDDNVGCFSYADDNCGNGFIDSGEYCDCGIGFNSMGSCDNDPCCNGTTCTLAENVMCSPQQGPCCKDSCTFVLPSEDEVCSDETDCSFNQTCNGTTAECPNATPKETEEGEDALSCNGGSNYCVDGECTGSICVPLLLDDCECEETDYQCHICCRLGNGTCASTMLIANSNETAKNLLPNKMGNVKEVGFPCNSFEGYCDFFHSCQAVNSEGAIKRITNIVSGSGVVQSVLNYVTRYWWAGLVGAVGILFISFLIVTGCHFFLPRPEHMKKRQDRRRNLRQSRRGRQRSRDGTRF